MVYIQFVNFAFGFGKQVYTVAKRLALERSNDYFLYSNVTKVAKQSNSSGGSRLSLDRHGGSSRKF